MAAKNASPIGDLLRARRLAARLTQEALAEAAGISARAIADLERGVIQAPRRDTLGMLAHALQLTSEERQEWESLRREISAGLSRPGPARTGKQLLPQPPNELVGRDREVAALVNLISNRGSRLVTVSGPGGVGKTRVALAAGEKLSDSFEDGVRFIELASVRDPELLIPAIAQHLGLRDASRGALHARLKTFLSQRNMLLILDNFEQLLQASPVIAEILAESVELKVLVTSRAGLRIAAEYEFPLSPLALPEWDNERDGTHLETYPSIELFIQRSRQVIPDFSITPETALAISSICWHLDGLPLAIELAAARVKVLSPEQILGRLTNRLGFLTSGLRDAPDRHQTMRGAIAWSYDLLDTDEQWLFRQLSVFSGGWTLESAEAIAHSGTDVLEGLTALVENSLVVQTTGKNGQTRFGMLETIREFGLERLIADGELQDAQRSHAEYFLRLAEEAEPHLKGPGQPEWLRLLALELPNLRSALSWSELPEVDAEFGLRLGGSLAWFWESRGHVSEGIDWLARALARENSRPDVRMKALTGAGWLAQVQRDLEASRAWLTQALAIAEDIGDRWEEAWTVHLLGRVEYFDGNADAAKRLGARSLEIARKGDDAWIEGWALQLLALAAHISDDLVAAREYYERSLEIRNRIGYPEGAATVTGLLGMLTLREGDDATALNLLRKSLETTREIGARWIMINMIANIVLIAARRGEVERAGRLAGFVSSMSDSIGASPIPIAESIFQEGLNIVRRELNDEDFGRLRTEGAALSMDEAIDEALWLESDDD